MPHTPAPWPLETVNTSVGVCHKIGCFPSSRAHHPITYACVYEDGLHLQRFIDQFNDGSYTTTLHANATLISAAPDLYAAMSDAMPYLEATLGPCDPECDCPLHACRAALAKVEER